MRAGYERLDGLDEVLGRRREQSARTAVFDIEPLIAFCDSGQEDLDRRVSLVASRAADDDGVHSFPQLGSASTSGWSCPEGTAEGHRRRHRRASATEVHGPPVLRGLAGRRLPSRDLRTVVKDKFVLEPVLAFIGSIRLRELAVTDMDRSLIKDRGRCSPVSLAEVPWRDSCRGLS